MTEKGKTTVGFALSKITTEQFEVTESNLPAEGAEIGIKMNFRFSANASQKMIGIFTNFNFHNGDKQFINVEGGCHFDIQPVDWDTMLNNEKTELTVPRELLRHLAEVTVGATRGILHARTENTDLNSFHLPIINIDNIVNSDSVFNLNEK